MGTIISRTTVQAWRAFQDTPPKNYAFLYGRREQSLLLESLRYINLTIYSHSMMLISSLLQKNWFGPKREVSEQPFYIYLNYLSIYFSPVLFSILLEMIVPERGWRYAPLLL